MINEEFYKQFEIVYYKNLDDAFCKIHYDKYLFNEAISKINSDKLIFSETICKQNRKPAIHSLSLLPCSDAIVKSSNSPIEKRPNFLTKFLDRDEQIVVLGGVLIILTWFLMYFY